MKKRKKIRNTIILVIDIIVILVVAYFVIGYFNFHNITKNEEPVFEGQVTTYEKGIGEVTVHDYKIYKIIEYMIPGSKVTYSMKLWFMDDVK